MPWRGTVFIPLYGEATEAERGWGSCLGYRVRKHSSCHLNPGAVVPDPREALPATHSPRQDAVSMAVRSGVDWTSSQSFQWRRLPGPYQVISTKVSRLSPGPLQMAVTVLQK